MMIDLEIKSEELKEIVAQFETKYFLGNISLIMQLITSPDDVKTLKGLSSPQRQLYYLAALNISSSPDKATRQHFTDKEFHDIKKILIEIESGYQQYFYPKGNAVPDKEWIHKVMVSMPTFLSYFNQGNLNYEEQTLERIIEYFTPFDKYIVGKFGLCTADFLSIYNFIEKLPQNYLDSKINHRDGQESWEKFTDRMISQGLRPDQWQEHLPEHFKNMITLMTDGGRMYRFTTEMIKEKFGEDKGESFVSIFSLQRKESGFLYYTEKNPLHFKPFFKIEEGEYQFMETKEICHSIYNVLLDFCANEDSIREKFFKVRGTKLEEKIIRIFRRFLGNEMTVYQGFFTEKGHEQDILILIKGTALIIEAKSSKIKEPRRDPNLAYDLILSNFNETIQKGYDQADRVKEYFLDKEDMKIFRDQELQQELDIIRTAKFHNVFSIVVTLERFGQIQNDLSEILEIYEDDEFPWSVCVDDLEVFILSLIRQKKTLSDFVHFLNIRQMLHGKLICSDELEVCAGYLKGQINMRVAGSNQTIATHPNMTQYFDNFYHRGGLGFENEKNMDIKTNKNTFIIGADSIHNSKAKRR